MKRECLQITLAKTKSKELPLQKKNEYAIPFSEFYPLVSGLFYWA